VGIPGENEVGASIGPGPTIVELEQSGGGVVGEGGTAWPIVGDGQKCLSATILEVSSSAVHVLVSERGLTDVAIMKVDEGVWSQLGHDGSYLCCQHKGEEQEEVVGVGTVSSSFEEKNLVDVRVV